jgi:hypothetical protein
VNNSIIETRTHRSQTARDLVDCRSEVGHRGVIIPHCGGGTSCHTAVWGWKVWHKPGVNSQTHVHCRPIISTEMQLFDGRKKRRRMGRCVQLTKVRAKTTPRAQRAQGGHNMKILGTPAFGYDPRTRSGHRRSPGPFLSVSPEP